MITPKIILAIDGLESQNILHLVESVRERVYAIKLHEAVDADPALISQISSLGVRVWVDYKLLDIPHTVGLRAKALKKRGAGIVSVHAAGGVEMVRAAVESGIPEVYAVTVLTSVKPETFAQEHGKSVQDVVIEYALRAAKAGAHGIVCSSHEVATLSTMPELKTLKLITPGVRSVGVVADDQSRVSTPKEALMTGATHLVIGREITRAHDPKKAFERIEADIFEFQHS